MKIKHNILVSIFLLSSLLSLAQETVIIPTELLWYSDFGYSPENTAKFMVKRVYDKETKTMVVQELRYGYGKTGKWLSMSDASYIKLEDYKEVSSGFVYRNNLELYTWDEEAGKTGISTIPALLKESPKFIFKVIIKEEHIIALNIYSDSKKVQTITTEEACHPDNFNLTYVDANYDGYLDVAINNCFYFYQPTNQTFELDKDLENTNFKQTTELSTYNLFTKSILGEVNVDYTVMYIAINGKLTASNIAHITRE